MSFKKQSHWQNLTPKYNGQNENKPKSKTVSFKTPFWLLGCITLVFTASKVFQVGICKDWSWFSVVSPLWIGPAFVISGILFSILLKGLALMATDRIGKHVLIIALLFILYWIIML